MMVFSFYLLFPFRFFPTLLLFAFFFCSSSSRHLGSSSLLFLFLKCVCAVLRLVFHLITFFWMSGFLQCQLHFIFLYFFLNFGSLAVYLIIIIHMPVIIEFLRTGFATSRLLTWKSSRYIQSSYLPSRVSEDLISIGR